MGEGKFLDIEHTVESFGVHSVVSVSREGHELTITGDMKLSTKLNVSIGHDQILEFATISNTGGVVKINGTVDINNENATYSVGDVAWLKVWGLFLADKGSLIEIGNEESSNYKLNIRNIYAESISSNTDNSVAYAIASQSKNNGVINVYSETNIDTVYAKNEFGAAEASGVLANFENNDSIEKAPQVNLKNKTTITKVTAEGQIPLPQGLKPVLVK